MLHYAALELNAATGHCQRFATPIFACAPQVQSLPYRAPEVLLGRKGLDEKIDLWCESACTQCGVHVYSTAHKGQRSERLMTLPWCRSLGCVLAEFLCGRCLFAGADKRCAQKPRPIPVKNAYRAWRGACIHTPHMVRSVN